MNQNDHAPSQQKIQNLHSAVDDHTWSNHECVSEQEPFITALDELEKALETPVVSGDRTEWLATFTEPRGATEIVIGDS